MSKMVHETDKDDDYFVDAQENQSKDSDLAIPSTSRAGSNKKLKKRNCDIIYLVSGKSIAYDGMPETTKYTRGENLVGGIAIREQELDSDACVFEWLLYLDLKGYFPRYILDNVYTTVMQEFMTHLRKFCDRLKENSEFFCLVEIFIYCKSINT